MNPVERPSKNLEQALKRSTISYWAGSGSFSAKPRATAGLSDHVLTRLTKTETWAQFVLEAVQQEVCLGAVQHNVYTCSYIFHPTRRHVAHTRRCHVFLSGGVIAPEQTYALAPFNRTPPPGIELFRRKLATPSECSGCKLA